MGPNCHRAEEVKFVSTLLPIAIDTADALGVAIRLRAAKEGVSPEDVVQDILRKALAPEIEEASGELPLAAVIQKVMQANGKSA
jgi:plasmid stability protein